MVSSRKRIAIFIDGSNFYHSLKSSFNKTNIDFVLFCNYLSKNNDLIIINYYSAPLNQKDNPEDYKKQQKFFNYLKNIKRLNLFLGRLEKRSNKHKTEKGVDVKIAIDILALAYSDKYDIAILVSNDSDFVPAVKEAQLHNRKVYNVSFPATKCFHLNRICDKTIKVNDVSEYLKD